MESNVRKSLEPQILAVSNAWRVLGRLGLVDTIFNHISVVAADSRGELYIAMNSYPYLPEELHPERVAVFPLRQYAPSEAEALGVNPDGLALHSLIHEVRMRPGAIIHTHSPYSIAVGCSEKGLLPLSQTAMEFTGEIGVIEYSCALRSQALNEQLRTLASSGGTAFLRNHGSLVVTDNVPEAVYITHYLEEACRVQVATLSQGVSFKMPDPEAVAATYRVLLADRKCSAEHLFNALCRQLASSKPAYLFSTGV